MLNRRFSFSATILIMLTGVLFFALVPAGLAELLDIGIPEWISVPLLYLGFYVSFEVAAKIGPEEFKTKIDGVISIDPTIRNKIGVFCSLLLPIVVFYYFSEEGFQSFLHGLMIFVLILICAYLFVFIFGSSKLRQSLLPDKLKKSSHVLTDTDGDK